MVTETPGEGPDEVSMKSPEMLKLGLRMEEERKGTCNEIAFVDVEMAKRWCELVNDETTYTCSQVVRRANAVSVA